MLRPDGPLGSNGSRYQLCYCLGLITREQRDDLKIIAKIRNALAHNFKVTKFDAEPIMGYCASLKQPCAVAAMPAQLFPPALAASGNGESGMSRTLQVHHARNTEWPCFRCSGVCCEGLNTFAAPVPRVGFPSTRTRPRPMLEAIKLGSRQILTYVETAQYRHFAPEAIPLGVSILPARADANSRERTVGIS